MVVRQVKKRFYHHWWITQLVRLLGGENMTRVYCQLSQLCGLWGDRLGQRIFYGKFCVFDNDMVVRDGIRYVRAHRNERCPFLPDIVIDSLVHNTLEDTPDSPW